LFFSKFCAKLQQSQQRGEYCKLNNIKKVSKNKKHPQQMGLLPGLKVFGGVGIRMKYS
jgi:hypothetical protein